MNGDTAGTKPGRLEEQNDVRTVHVALVAVSAALSSTSLANAATSRCFLRFNLPDTR
jgi:hypothetical protein